jgi:septal ring factor EnvC (AmiA/AmiB activator)
MGWVSYFEDDFERLQEHISSVEVLLQDEAVASDIRLKSALKAVMEAKGLLAVAREHLDLATSPELNIAYELNECRRKISHLEAELAAARQESEKLRREAALQSARLGAAKEHVSQITKEKRRVEKKFEEMAHKDFGAAVDAYTSPEMIKRHKPNA